MLSFHDKLVWLTGASQGIGAALCRELSKRGARVAITARSTDHLISLEQELKPRVYSFPGDVTDLDRMKLLASEIESTMGPIDVVIANAGSCFYIDELNFSSEACLALMQLNYGGVLHCIEAVLPQMLKRGKGHIVGIASLAGYRGLPRAGAYGATKAALINFLEGFRYQLDRHGLSVTIINPGFVDTPLTRKNKFPMPQLLSVEVAAEYICNGLERQKTEITFPYFFSLFMKLMQVLPHSLYQRIVSHTWRRLGHV